MSIGGCEIPWETVNYVRQVIQDKGKGLTFFRVLECTRDIFEFVACLRRGQPMMEGADDLEPKKITNAKLVKEIEKLEAGTEAVGQAGSPATIMLFLQMAKILWELWLKKKK